MAAAPPQESSKDLSPRRKNVVLVNAYEKEMVCNLAKQHALGSRIPLVAGSAIVDIGNLRIIATSLSVGSNVFTELLKRLPTVAVDADDTIITKIKERVVAALNDSGTPMIREHNLPLVIVCSPFEESNGCLAPKVDVWVGPEELELTWGPDNNFEFTVMDFRKTLSPGPLRVMEVPLVTFLGHYYPLAGRDSSGNIIVDSIAWNHIVSDKGRLEDFKKYATPRMARLCDGTNFPIVGVGKMKTEAFDIPGVEFAPDLKVDFISVNQLDRDHKLTCRFHGKKLEIRKDDGTVVGAGALEDNGIYVLKHLQVPAEPEM
ncbi:hypothetical protein BAE44_0006494 [Dichanthelium oligosanthes]|uniref:Retrovirus-related Pol polyprotein from transposon TNT 1-94-like beta-barrel domain-containing protein n=1 Tax=Dichanthelium oligosanthes TaxID=888268 RepID=A0A1E5W4Z6_9POAL|nr:hypothetical protein BAE44_0006494 [Dichanthelium oligosanthes]